jgi:hypothetical protein
LSHLGTSKTLLPIWPSVLEMSFYGHQSAVFWDIKTEQLKTTCPYCVHMLPMRTPSRISFALAFCSLEVHDTRTRILHFGHTKGAEFVSLYNLILLK